MAWSRRRAFWGYRIKPTDLYIEALEERAAERQTMREASISQLKTDVQEAEAAVAAMETSVKTLQSEYFRLSSDLNALTLRFQEMLDEATTHMSGLEDQARERVDQRRHYAKTLEDTLRGVPESIRGVIEHIANAITRTTPDPKAPTQLSDPAISEPPRLDQGGA